MRAITYRRYGGPEVLELSDVAEPKPAEGQVLVRVEASSINAADARLMRANPFLVRLVNGLLRPKKRRVLGQDVAGVVVGLGPGVTGFALGDRVFGETPMSAQGAFAERCVVEVRALAKLPDALSFDVGAALPLAGTTALQALRAAQVTKGSRVLLVGAGGGVGLFAVQAARALGAVVTATCGPRTVELVQQLGAEQVFDHQRVALASVKGPFDAVIAINGDHSLATYRRLLAPGGRYLLVGGSNAQLFAALAFAKPFMALSGKRGAVLTIDPARQADDLRQLAAWTAAGTMRVELAAVFPMAAVAKAMTLAEQGHVRGKIALTEVASLRAA